MKFAQLTSIAATAVLTLLGLPVSLSAQDEAKTNHPHQYHHYQLVDVGTFGGPQSFLNLPGLPAPGVLNNRGSLAGTADTSDIDPLCGNHPPDCYTSHGFVWKDGTKTDLGILPGGTNSQVNWISANGFMTGVDDYNQPDPLLGTPFQLHGIFWGHDGAMTDVGALSGTNFAFPSAVNSRGEVVGQGLDTIPDPNGIYGWGFQSRAFYWENGAMQDLGTLGTGTNAIAQMINDRGQVVGWSYTSSAPAPLCISGVSLTTGTFIWDKKNGMRDIGGLGGTCTYAIALNNKGQIVGGSTLIGDLEIHAFVWDAATGITELPTTAGLFADARAINDNGEAVGWGEDPSGTARDAMLWRKRGGRWQVTDLGRPHTPDCAVGTSVNASGQVLGYSGTGQGCVGAAFVWEEGGPIADLNTLIPSNSGIQLYETGQINDRGEIAVNGLDANGNNHDILLIPCDENHPDVEGCDYDLIDAATAAARVSPDPTQRPPALTPGTLRSGMMNRFRFPKSRPVPGHAPVPGASLAIPAAPATGDWLDDHQLVPRFGTASYCEMFNGVLTGLCLSHTAYSCPGSFAGCNTGQPATLGAPLVCGNTEHQLSTTKCGSVPGFNVSTTGLTPTTVSAGGSATSTMTVSVYGGFSGSVAFSCSVQPSPALAPTCLFSPSSVTSGTPSTLTVSTTAPTSALRTGTGSGLFYAFFLPLSGLFATVLRFGPRQEIKGKFTAPTLACMLLAGVVLHTACGAKTPTPGTPAGSYIITVTGTDSSGTLAIPTTLAPLDVQ
jgi:probable HAF family extracellular repeat protein